MRNKKYVVIFLLVSTLLLSSFSFYVYQMINSPNILVDKDDRLFVIKADDTFKSVQDKLYEDHYVHDLVAFSFLAKIMKYHENVKPGRYLLKSNMSNRDAIRLLRSGDQVAVNITFNNVRLVEELGEKITRGIAISPAKFDSALSTFIANNDKGFNKENIISMFIPNTYQVYYDVTAEDLISRMNKEYNNFWTEDRKNKAKELKLDPFEVSTLASIVQAESVKKDETKTIAGLYYNRLTRGIALQADPTLVFALKQFDLKRVLNVHKEVESPYNTYKYAGLPPGPINMPTIHSIDAVLNYEKHNYIYMCAKEDFSGYHNFATNLSDHNRNAQKYQRQLSIEQRKARLNAG